MLRGEDPPRRRVGVGSNVERVSPPRRRVGGRVGSIVEGEDPPRRRVRGGLEVMLRG